MSEPGDVKSIANSSSSDKLACRDEVRKSGLVVFYIILNIEQD